MRIRLIPTPISDHVLTVSDGVLQAPRNSRYEVAAFIMSDLREAVKRLPKETEIPEGSKGKVSNDHWFYGHVTISFIR